MCLDCGGVMFTTKRDKLIRAAGLQWVSHEKDYLHLGSKWIDMAIYICFDRSGLYYKPEKFWRDVKFHIQASISHQSQYIIFSFKRHINMTSNKQYHSQRKGG